ncbi:MAG: molybdate ABC transporter permease subunit [Deltaproteobacteria bacterium]|nr:MAG: molybdate ABC transporter permease subunit [Deltaproteobacteria bacterium]
MTEIILLSLRIALVAVLLSLPFAILVAWVLARVPFRGRLLLDVFVHLPLVLPPIVTGYVLLVVFGGHGPLADLGLAFTSTGASVAAAVVAFPLLVRPIRQAFEATDPALLHVAMSLGASPRRAFFTVALPLAAPGILAGALLAFGRSLGEFGATITFVGNIDGETRTLPLALFSALDVPGRESEATAFAIASAVLALGTLVLGELLARRSRRWTTG